jgi:hypothetical protein
MQYAVTRSRRKPVFNLLMPDHLTRFVPNGRPQVTPKVGPDPKIRSTQPQAHEYALYHILSRIERTGDTPRQPQQRRRIPVNELLERFAIAMTDSFQQREVVLHLVVERDIIRREIGRLRHRVANLAHAIEPPNMRMNPAFAKSFLFDTARDVVSPFFIYRTRPGDL